MLEEFKKIIPEGIMLDTERSNNSTAYLIINGGEYNTILSQVGIINFMELSKPDDLNTFYCVDDGDYFTAKEFRIAHGYDNRFFEAVESKHFGKSIEEIGTVIPEKRD